MTKEQKAEMKAYLLELQNDFIITNENEAMIFKLSYEKAFSLNGVSHQRKLLIAYELDTNKTCTQAMAEAIVDKYLKQLIVA
tara:strand:- start:375 stop:620 length:246 start_codon:yes stop_codon:yes gene_type:complete